MVYCETHFLTILKNVQYNFYNYYFKSYLLIMNDKILTNELKYLLQNVFFIYYLVSNIARLITVALIYYKAVFQLVNTINYLLSQTSINQIHNNSVKKKVVPVGNI